MCDIRAKDIIQWQNEQISFRDEKGKPYAPTYLKTLQSELSAKITRNRKDTDISNTAKKAV